MSSSYEVAHFSFQHYYVQVECLDDCFIIDMVEAEQDDDEENTSKKQYRSIFQYHMVGLKKNTTINSLERFFNWRSNYISMRKDLPYGHVQIIFKILIDSVVVREFWLTLEPKKR